jgi:hypothetical protein
MISNDVMQNKLKLSKLQIAILKRLYNDSIDGIVAIPSSTGTLFKFRQEPQEFIRFDTMNSLRKTGLLSYNEDGTYFDLSSNGLVFVVNQKKREEASIFKAIIARIPKELREPKRKYFKG